LGRTSKKSLALKSPDFVANLTPKHRHLSIIGPRDARLCKSQILDFKLLVNDRFAAGAVSPRPPMGGNREAARENLSD
jgi:hypothetical protein